MSRKAAKIKPEAGKRLYEWLSYIGMTQTELAERTHYTQQHLSNVSTGKRAMTLDLAESVSKNAPLIRNAADTMPDNPGTYIQPDGTYIADRVRPEWLLCLDDIRSTNAMTDATLKQIDDHTRAAVQLIGESFKRDGYVLKLNTEQPDEPFSPYTATAYFLMKDGEIAQRISFHEWDILTQSIDNFIRFTTHNVIKK